MQLLAIVVDDIHIAINALSQLAALWTGFTFCQTKTDHSSLHPSFYRGEYFNKKSPKIMIRYLTKGQNTLIGLSLRDLI